MSNFLTYTNNTFSGSTTSSIHALEIEFFWKLGESWLPNQYTWSSRAWMRTPWFSNRLSRTREEPFTSPYTTHQYTITGHALEQTFRYLLDECLPETKYCHRITRTHCVRPNYILPEHTGCPYHWFRYEECPNYFITAHVHIGCAFQG